MRSECQTIVPNLLKRHKLSLGEKFKNLTEENPIWTRPKFIKLNLSIRMLLQEYRCRLS